MYEQVRVKLSAGQKQKVAKAIENGIGVSIRLNSQSLQGKDPLLLTKTQYKHFQAAKTARLGILLKLSNAQLKAMKKGGILPFLAPLIPAGIAAAKALGMSALSGLGSYGIQKTIQAATKGRGLKLEPYPGRGLNKKNKPR